jgi:hypothetical protein
MSKWPMRGHFGHLHFKTFTMTPRTPQGEVFCPLLSNFKASGVSEDSKSPTLGVWVSSSHLAKVGLWHVLRGLLSNKFCIDWSNVIGVWEEIIVFMWLVKCGKVDYSYLVVLLCSRWKLLVGRCIREAMLSNMLLLPLT